jgi:hypothetical protein
MCPSGNVKVSGTAALGASGTGAGAGVSVATGAEVVAVGEGSAVAVTVAADVVADGWLVACGALQAVPASRMPVMVAAANSWMVRVFKGSPMDDEMVRIDAFIDRIHAQIIAAQLPVWIVISGGL